MVLRWKDLFSGRVGRAARCWGFLCWIFESDEGHREQMMARNKPFMAYAPQLYVPANPERMQTPEKARLSPVVSSFYHGSQSSAHKLSVECYHGLRCPPLRIFLQLASCPLIPSSDNIVLRRTHHRQRAPRGSGRATYYPLIDLYRHLCSVLVQMPHHTLLLAL